MCGVEGCGHDQGLSQDEGPEMVTNKMEIIAGFKSQGSPVRNTYVFLEDFQSPRHSSRTEGRLLMLAHLPTKENPCSYCRLNSLLPFCLFDDWTAKALLKDAWDEN